MTTADLQELAEVIGLPSVSNMTRQEYLAFNTRIILAVAVNNRFDQDPTMDYEVEGNHWN